MYITKEELEKRLNKTAVSIKERERATRKSIKKDENGKVIEEGENRLTHEDRVVIGVLSHLDSNKNVAELVGVSAQTVSYNSRGLVGESTGLDVKLRDEVESKVAKIGEDKIESEKRIQDQLLTNLAAALGQVAGNIHNTDAVEASKVATDMSKILERVSGNGRDSKGSRTAIIINVPPMKDEKSYQSIVV